MNVSFQFVPAAARRSL